MPVSRELYSAPACTPRQRRVRHLRSVDLEKYTFSRSRRVRVDRRVSRANGSATQAFASAAGGAAAAAIIAGATLRPAEFVFSEIDGAEGVARTFIPH
eukprot:1190761-Prorocentrum_minimum.AAC.1